MERADVVVVGGGLIGSAIAWRLQQAGRRVILFERGEPGAEASSAAVGLLLPEAGREGGPDLLALWQESLDRYPAFIGELRETTGVAVEFRQTGSLALALNAAESDVLSRRFRAQVAVKIPAELLSGDDARAIEPALGRDVQSALHFPRHGLVDNQRLSKVVPTAAAKAGVQVRAHEPVLGISVRSGRVEGVETYRGRIAAEVVVNAAGSWASLGVPIQDFASGSLAKAEGDVPLVRPTKGEVIVLWTQTRPIERLITVSGASIVARSDGRVIVGGTLIDNSFDRAVTVGGVASLISAAVGAIPELTRARFADAWIGLRPRSRDDGPIIGSGGISGLFWATGHFKTGILSTVATADIVTAMIEGKPHLPVDSLSPRRFGV
ncbi:MAG TPA: FAD-dependent oxidoreductase [Chloroflexota bacterium]|nr:FAD-dependent oxidoreductase [Chloroflexota bacterium]